jgi:hypothetical protein
VTEAFFTRNPSDLFCAIQLYIIVPATFLPSGPDDTFSDSLYAWKIAKFGYSATAPLRATPLGPA